VRGLQVGEYTAAQREGALGYAFGVDTQLIVDGTYFIAESAGVFAGSGGWSRRRTLFGADHGPVREAELLDPAVDAAKIRAIFVHPAWARRGLGSLILKHCEEAAREAGFLDLEMGSTLTGVPLYALRGYRELERVEVEVEVALPNGEALGIVRMAKTLRSSG
jgi:GNAT superfamily N-acetyltransferase